MQEFSLIEAQLFRLLVQFFGKDNVIPRMRVVAVCGGVLSPDLSPLVREWAAQANCLFTIVDTQDTPKLVVEFFAGFDSYVDAREEEHQRMLPELLAQAGVHYVTFSEEELNEVLDPRGGVDFYQLLRAKFESLEVVSKIPV
ncbi:MAG: hypothetical protein QY326_00900 [Bdellovibrionota bacterium]|nr:MAG: hypothetical protein QY326_00900 [Bdellovibrionota bacterium]